MPSQCLLSHTDIYYLLSDIYINIYLFPEIQETAVFQAFSLPCHAQCSLYGFIPIAQSISPDYTIQTQGCSYVRIGTGLHQNSFMIAQPNYRTDALKIIVLQKL